MRKRCLLVVVAVVLICGQTMSGSAARVKREQTHFSAEDEHVAKPEPLPRELKELLLQDLKRQGDDDVKGMTADTLPADWFSASVIQLGSSERKDWIVEGEGEQRGANICPFWVFVSSEHGYRLVLVALSHDLQVERGRTHGYRNILTESMTCCQSISKSYRFNGREYRQHRVLDQKTRLSCLKRSPVLMSGFTA